MSDQSPPERPPPSHWLVELAALSFAESITLPLQPTPEQLAEAWAAISAVSGLSDEDLASRIASHFGLEAVELSDANPQATKLVPVEIARRYGVFPFDATDAEILVATADPHDRRARADLEGVSGRYVRFMVATPDEIARASSRFYSPDEFLETVVTNLVTETRPDGVQVVRPIGEEVSELELESPAVVKLTTLVLDQLASAGAEELHVEPELDGGRVRVRVNGELRHFMHMPLAAARRVVARLKKLGGLDLSEHIQSQHGRVQITHKGEQRELFVATTPGLNGEKLSVLAQEPDYDYFIAEMQQTVELARAAASAGTVLVVDDDESARLLMRSVLEKLDFNVLEAEDGPPALRTLLDRGDISLVMLDLNMPEMNGQAVLERIRKTMATAGLPVIVLTGIEDPAVEIALLEAGADDYLRKPIDPERLRVRVKAVLRRAGVLQPA
jgi:CheY-like chemotaxis protein